MFVLLIFGDHVAGNEVELDVKSVLRALVVLELLHLVRLLQPALEDSTHALHGTLRQLVSTTLVIVYPPTCTKSYINIYR